MKKYDYYELLCNLTENEYKAYLILSENDTTFARDIYRGIIDNVAGACGLFLSNESGFIQWLINKCPQDTEFTYLETTIIGYLDRNKDFMGKIYKGDVKDFLHLSHTMLISWKNKTKSLKQNLNMYQMLYFRYIRFLNTEAGQNFLFYDSSELIPEFDENDNEDETVSFEDKPFYEQYEYKMKNLLNCKRDVLNSKSLTPIERCEMGALWDATFFPTNNEKFSYLNAAKIVRKTVSEKIVSRTTLYYHLKRLRVLMYEILLNDGILEEYFDVNTIYNLDGEIKGIKDLISDYLADAKYELELAKSDKKKNNQISAVGIVDAVTKFCDDRGILYKNMTGNVLLKIKMDSLHNKKKSWKLYVFKSGAFIDFRNDITGYITQIIPSEYFVGAV